MRTLSHRNWITRLFALALPFFMISGARADTDAPPARSASPAAPAAAASAPTLVIIQTDPPGAQLFVDGVDSGRGPTVLDKLAPGKHHIVAKLEDHAPAEQDLEVKAAETTTTRLTLSLLQGTLQISTTESVSCTLGALKMNIGAGEVPLVKVPAGPLSIHCEGDGLLPINQSVRVSGDQTATIALKPTRMITSDKIRVESPDTRNWELRGGDGKKLCALPCTLTWPGRGMTVQLTSDLNTIDRELKTLPDEIPFLPEPGTTVDSIWVRGRGNLTKSIVGISLSAVLIGAAIPLCILNANSESGTNVAAGISCVGLGVLGVVGGTLATISLVTYSAGRWNFTAAIDPDAKTEAPRHDDLKWSFAFGGTSGTATLSF